MISVYERELGKFQQRVAGSIIEENSASETFAEELWEILRRFEPDRVADAVADAQAASLAIAADASRADSQASGYRQFVQAIDRGLELLQRIATSREAIP
jgi:uncharacterized protein with von Willebrand factor type A (vWA) domain